MRLLWFHNHDSKIYTIPSDLTVEKAFDIGKETVQQHDIKFIREFEKKKPYEAEAWYYGVTKVKKNQLVIRCSILEDTNSIELFGASSDETSLTGLLAELGHNLNDKIKEKGIIQPIQQITNITIKDSIIQRSSLLFGEVQKPDETVIEDSVIQKSDIAIEKKAESDVDWE